MRFFLMIQRNTGVNVKRSRSMEARRMTLGRKISLSLDRAYMNQHRTAHTLCFRKHFSDFFYVGAIHRA